VSGTTLFCLRHAESEDNAARVHSSRPPGTGLTERGRRQAAVARDQLAGRHLAAVYTSTAARAEQTGAVVAQPSAARVHTMPELLEYDLGEFDGTTMAGGGGRTLAVLRAWITEGDLAARLPGGESGFEVRARFGTAMTAIAAAHAGADVAVVSHVGTLTVGLLALCDDLTSDQVWGLPLPNATPLTVTFDGTSWHCAPWPANAPSD
jgi:broad specificity phosphatase PhoE